MKPNKNQKTNHSIPSPHWEEPLVQAAGMTATPASAAIARLDKWLWAARIFKTRTLAAAACKRGQVTIAGAPVKPSCMVKAAEIVDVRKPPITYSFRILQAIEHRVGAKLIPQILENITPPEQYELLEMNRISGFVGRARGTGRPTKKERRALDNFDAQTAHLPVFFSDFDFDLDDGEEE